MPVINNFIVGEESPFLFLQKTEKLPYGPSYADMMIAIVPGEIRFQDEDDRWHTAVAGGGFAQVINNRVMVLADSIEKPEEVDIKRAQEAKERAQEQLRQKQSQQEYYISKAALARAMARMKVSKEIFSKKVLLLFMYCILISYNVQDSLTKRIIVDRITKKVSQ